jgi:hypothetical protein
MRGLNFTYSAIMLLAILGSLTNIAPLSKAVTAFSTFSLSFNLHSYKHGLGHFDIAITYFMPL